MFFFMGTEGPARALRFFGRRYKPLPGARVSSGDLQKVSTYRPEQYRAIKGSIDQNPTYAIGTVAGEQYRSSLKDLPAAMQAKWVRGEWGAVDGCYFTIWDASRMVIPFAEIPGHWWDSHFLSIDYGFGRSSAAPYMHVCLQDGRIVTIAEIVEKHMPVYEFGAEIIRRFDINGTHQNGQRRNVVVVYQDPANKSQTGTGHSVRDQLNEVLAECDLGAIDGSNDRMGGWLLIYEMLARGRWLIADTCPLLIAAIASRVHEPKKPGDVLKVGGDPLDDAMDAARYGLYSFIKASEKPRELVMRDECMRLAEQGDLTSAMIRYRQMADESEASYKPSTLGRRRR